MSKPATAVLWLTITTILSLGLSQAQEAAPLARHPGDVIKYRLVFDGPNADKITHVTAAMGVRGPTPKDQAGFDNVFAASNVLPASPKTFELEIKVPLSIATGDYHLSFTAFATEGFGNYADGQEFHTPPIHIENPKNFTPPAVTVTPQP
jgi:hypothetical protein